MQAGEARALARAPPTRHSTRAPRPCWQHCSRWIQVHRTQYKKTQFIGFKTVKLCIVCDQNFSNRIASELAFAPFYSRKLPYFHSSVLASSDCSCALRMLNGF